MRHLPYVQMAAHFVLAAAARKWHDVELEALTVSVLLELLTVYGRQSKHFLLHDVPDILSWRASETDTAAPSHLHSAHMSAHYGLHRRADRILLLRALLLALLCHPALLSAAAGRQYAVARPGCSQLTVRHANCDRGAPLCPCMWRAQLRGLHTECNLMPGRAWIHCFRKGILLTLFLQQVRC